MNDIDRLQEELADLTGTEPISFRKLDEPGHVVRVEGRNVAYSTLSAAARGIGGVLAGWEGEERRAFDSFGAMLDVSRNGVPTVATVKRWLRRLALLGFDRFMLYTEDLYLLPDEPAFGHLRGAYSLDEIREIDDCAARLGIEVVGCIQTLGHLPRLLRWHQHYDEVADTTSVLLAGAAPTERLIGKMLDFWSSALRSRRIHLGMDETHGLGSGRYCDLHGPRNRFDIFNEHLASVNALCAERGLEPMIWSDMYFRFASPTGDYYDPNVEIPPEVAAAIPENIRLIYWDYYHDNAEFYRSFIGKHRRAGFEPVFAGCVRGVRNFWYDRILTENTLPAAVAACREERIHDFFITLWQDDGSVCRLDSLWAGLTGAADLAYGAERMDGEWTARRCEAVTGEAFRRALCASDLELHLAGVGGKDFRCFSIYLLWDDPLLGITFDGYQAQLPDFAARAVAHFEALAQKLGGKEDHARLVARTLLLKLRFRAELERAYDAGDRAALRTLAEQSIPELIGAMESLSESFRREWLAVYKPFGRETIQVRQAGVIERLRETRRVLLDYLGGSLPEIAELAGRRDVRHYPYSYLDAAFAGYF